MVACNDELSWIAQLFHSLPHVNFDFANTSSVFNPHNVDYQQALVLYGAVPCLFGFLVLVLLCGQYVASCCSAHCACDRRARGCKSKRCALVSGWLLCFSVLICSGSIISAFVFNDNVDQGVKQVSVAVENVNGTLLEVQTKADDVKSNLLNMEDKITDLQEDHSIPEPLEKQLSLLKTEVRRIIATLTRVKKVSLPDIDEYVNVTEYYRWWGTFGTLALSTFMCILVFYAVLRKSICGFVLVILVGSCCLLLDWASCGVDLALAIGMADLCVNPESAILVYTSAHPLSEVVKYYISCPSNGTNPYEKYVDTAIQNLNGAVDIVRLLEKGPWVFGDELKDISNGLQQVSSDVHVIRDDLNCSSVRQDYEIAQCALCSNVVPSLAELLLATVILGLFLIFLLISVTPILHSIPPDRQQRKKWNVLTCSLDYADETPYQSFSEGSSEAVPLLASGPPRPVYDGGYQSVEYQFHSCEDGPEGRRLHPGYGGSDLLNRATAPPPQVQPVITRLQTDSQITSMAF